MPPAPFLPRRGNRPIYASSEDARPPGLLEEPPDGFPDAFQAIWAAAVLDLTLLVTRPAKAAGPGPQRAGTSFPALDAPGPDAARQADDGTAPEPALPSEPEGERRAEPDPGHAEPSPAVAATAPEERAAPPIPSASTATTPPRDPAPPRTEGFAAVAQPQTPPQTPATPGAEQSAATGPTAAPSSASLSDVGGTTAQPPDSAGPALSAPPALLAFWAANSALPPDPFGDGLHPAALLDHVAGVAAGLATLQSALLALPPPSGDAAPIPALPDLPVLPDLVLG
jgi:hypothetical protein